MIDFAGFMEALLTRGFTVIGAQLPCGIQLRAARGCGPAPVSIHPQPQRHEADTQGHKWVAEADTQVGC